MADHLTEAQARAQGLPGSDTIIASHLSYRENLSRDAGVANLCREALKAFVETITITYRREIIEEQQAWEAYIRRGGHIGTDPVPSAQMGLSLLNYMNLENLKIAAGFELALKAVLLQGNFVIHQIEGRAPYLDLRNRQRNEPIAKADLLAIDGYRFDGQRNYLPGLCQESLKFSTITRKPAYRMATGLPDSELDVIEEYRQLRNQIHLPGDIVETPKMAAHPDVLSFLINFINVQIVVRANSINAIYGWTDRNLEPLSP